MMRKRAGILAGVYLFVAASAIAYELSIRLYDRGNSEFAGMLSTLLTLPASLVMIWIGKAAAGVNVGDSDTSFVVLLGLSAIVNALVMWALLRTLSRRT